MLKLIYVKSVYDKRVRVDTSDSRGSINKPVNGKLVFMYNQYGKRLSYDNNISTVIHIENIVLP